MAKLTDEQRRALRILARSPNGCTEAIMMARGFTLDLLATLVIERLAKAEEHATMAGSNRMKVVWITITAAGRQAIAE
jgi:hypothetical protein